MQHKVERARELRKAIVAGAAALTAMAGEIARIDQDPETRRPGGGAEWQRMAGGATPTLWKPVPTVPTNAWMLSKVPCANSTTSSRSTNRHEIAMS